MRGFGLACALSLVSGTAVAVPVTWVAEGSIIFARDSGALPLSPQLGDRFSYALTFDNEAPDTDESPYFGNFPDAIQSAIFSVGGASYALPVGPLSLAYSYAGYTDEYYQLTFDTRSEADTLPLLASTLSFVSTSALALDTDSFPALPPSDLAIYQITLDLLLYQTSEQIAGLSPIPYVRGQIDSILQRPVSVPEPATAALLLIGMVGAGVARRRKSRSHN